MVIKVSTLLAHSTVVQDDSTPTLGGALNVNGFPIINGGNPVTITNNSYPTTLGSPGQVITTNGSGNLYFADPPTSLKLYAENPAIYITPVALGNNSIALGDGAQTSSTALDSLAIGLQSLARTQGSIVQASGRFSSTGDAQAGRYLLRSITINSVPTELFIDGTAGSVRLVLPDDATWTFRVTITGHRTDSPDGHAGYTSSGVIYRTSGPSTTAILGSIQKSVLAESNQVWDINTSADPINGSIKITVVGETGKTIRWVALVETVEITN